MILISKYPDVVSVSEFDVGKTDLVAHQIITGDAAPINRHPYRLSPAEQQTVDDLVHQMRRHGIKRESDSPWAAPIVIVRKKDGTLRFCCDWRDLNAVTRKDGYRLPRIDATLDRLRDIVRFMALSGKRRTQDALREQDVTFPLCLKEPPAP